MVIRLMNSKEGSSNFNELVGEAAFDVLLTGQPVTDLLPVDSHGMLLAMSASRSQRTSHSWAVRSEPTADIDNIEIC